MPHKIIRTDADFDALGRLLSNLKRPFTVQYSQGANRSLDQNSLMWKWAGEAALQLGDVTADEVQRRWKLEIGVPILRSEDEPFRAFYDSALKGRPYSEKLAAMKYVPVTRVMTMPQMTALIEGIQREAVEQGIQLTNPEDV